MLNAYLLISVLMFLVSGDLTNRQRLFLALLWPILLGLAAIVVGVAIVVLVLLVIVLVLALIFGV